VDRALLFAGIARFPASPTAFRLGAARTPDLWTGH